MTARRRLSRVALAAAALLLLPVAGQAAGIELVNRDDPGEGFNEATPAQPVTGNPGRTLGQQRLNVFNAVAWRLGSQIASDTVMRIEASWKALSCSALSGTLASAGPTFVFRDFPKAPKPRTWYASALANTLAGTDLNGQPSMRIQFNKDIGTTGCLSTRGWDYRIGVTEAGGFSMEDILLHEIGHGNNFVTFVDLDTGEKFQGLNDAFMINMEDHTAGSRWSNLSNSARKESMINTGNLHWIGGNALAHALHLRQGAHAASGHPQLYAPEPLAPGSSVSHWDTSLTRNADDYMEPFASAIQADLLSLHLFQDLGWSVNRNAIGWVEDQNGNGSIELVVLKVSADSSAHEVVVLDSQSRAVLLRIEIPADWSALDLAVVPSFAGSGSSEIAVLLWKLKGNLTRVWIFDAGTGEQLRNLPNPSGFPMRMVAVPDYRATAAWELAILGVRPGTGARVWIKDAQSGNTRALSFPGRDRPVDFAFLEDFGGGPGPEVAVILARPQNGEALIKVRDAGSGALLSTLPLLEGEAFQFLRAVSDFGGEAGVEELAVVSLIQTTGSPRVRTYDASSGQILALQEFNEPFLPSAFDVLPHFGDSPADEYVLWTRRSGTLKMRAHVFDGRSGETLSGPSLASRFEPRAIGVVPNVGRSGAFDMVVLAANARQRLLSAILFDGAGGQIRSIAVR